LLFVPRPDHWKVRLLSRLVYVPKRRKITLDEIGSAVWEMCDSKTSVARMIAHIEQTYKVNRKEAELSLLNYLKTLGEKGLIGFLLDKKKKTART